MLNVYVEKGGGNNFFHENSDIFILIVYFGSIISFVLLLEDGVIKAHDAYSFWARAARELYLFDKGYFNADSNIAHWDYNPIFASLQYSITKVFGWSTKYLYYVIIACFTTSLCAVIDTMEVKSKWKIAFLCLVVLFYPTITLTYSTTFLGADGSMAFLFVTGVLCWHSRREDNYTEALPVILASIILPAIKLYSGLMFSLVLGIMLMLSVWRKCNKAMGISLAAMVIGILYMQFSWSAYFNYNTDKAAYERIIAINEYQGIDENTVGEEPSFKLSYFLKGNPRTEQLSTSVDKSSIQETFRLSKESMKQFLVGRLYNSSMHIVSMVFLTIFAYLLLCKNERKERMRHTLIWLFCAAIVYIAGMFGTYLVQPGTANEPIRYIGVVVIPMVIALLYYATEYFEEKNAKIILLVAMLIIVLDSDPQKIWDSYSADVALEYKPAVYVKNVLCNELGTDELAYSEDERVLIIDNNEGNTGLGASGVIYAYHYYFLPRRGKTLYFEFGNTEALETMTSEYLEMVLIQDRIDVIAVMADDEEMQNKLSNIFKIPINSEKEAYFIDVDLYNGDFNYTLRKSGGKQ